MKSALTKSLNLAVMLLQLGGGVILLGFSSIPCGFAQFGSGGTTTTPTTPSTPSTPPTVSPNPANPPSSTPLFVANNTTPLVMLNISKDHQLFFKAYDDYSDLNGDGVPDTTYNNSINYYGYFDSFKCYNYNATTARFEPASTTGNYYCNGNWSGNFLNWATMARIDEIRKILYGGSRSVDTGQITASSSGVSASTPGVTVLSRTYIPNDAHSFAKFYNGTDINLLTPFNPSQVTATVDGVSTTTSVGVTFCNTTVSSTVLSQNVTDPPVMRVALGNYSMWTNHERWQCKWSTESANTNGNNPAISGINAYPYFPDPGSIGSSVLNQYNVQVQVCVPGLINTETCKTYPDGTQKPIGLLQIYGDNNEMSFGLLTGSYGANKSGGVLRKNLSSMNNEINVATNGTFINPPPANGGIINTLEIFRMYGYRHDNGTYFKSGTVSQSSASTLDSLGTTDGTANCIWGLTSFPDGNCSNWGNPQSEMFLESLRYLGNQSASAAFVPTSPSESFYFPGLAIASTIVSSSNPTIIPSTQWCTKQSLIDFNASSSSYDGDQLSGISDLNSSYTTPSPLTDTVGVGENINGNSYFVGSTNLNGSGVTNNQLCTPKTVNSLSSVNGTCPDSPRLQGTYQIDGLAFYGNTKDLEPSVQGNQTVSTFGVALAPKLPLVQIPVPNSSSNQVITIIPGCQDSTLPGNCTQSAFQIVDQNCSNSLIQNLITQLKLSSNLDLSSVTKNCGLLYANY
ncbi:MAG: hypothetical protein ABSB19_12800, partial [Methylomonas sp.]